MSLAQANRVEILRDRAHMLARCRAFFEERGVLEVDVPILSERASVDAHIDLIQASCGSKRVFLHSSPEYGMKRLLAEGIGDCYQLSHVFRDGEVGERHNPEFLMAEWYRCGLSFKEMIEETVAFCRLFLTVERVEQFSYDEAFSLFTDLDYREAAERDLLFATKVESHLGKACFTVLTDFPASDAALAQTAVKGEREVAMRFEIFHRGVELANGYLELREAREHERRFEAANRKRMALGKESYPLDVLFLEALERGIPECCGVAVGFDRLMMLRHAAHSIHEVIPFGMEVS